MPTKEKGIIMSGENTLSFQICIRMFGHSPETMPFDETIFYEF